MRTLLASAGLALSLALATGPSVSAQEARPANITTAARTNMGIQSPERRPYILAQFSTPAKSCGAFPNGAKQCISGEVFVCSNGQWLPVGGRC